MTAEGTRILVTATTRASPDGVTVHTYRAGEVYGPDSDPPMPPDLAATFLRERWGERCDGAEDACLPIRQNFVDLPVEPASPEPDAACVWCQAPYTARKQAGGPVQRFCSDACRAGFHRGARRWVARELEAGRLDIADLREG